MTVNVWHAASIMAVASAVLVGMQAPALDQLGPRIGERIPDFTGVDQFGREQTLATIAGDAGAFVVFFRSADW